MGPVPFYMEAIMAKKYVLAALGAALMVVSSAQVLSAENSFEEADRMCRTGNVLKCVKLNTSGVMLEKFLAVFNHDPNTVLPMNNWDETMLKKELPTDKFFRVKG